MTTLDFRQDLLPLKDKIFRLALRITLNPQDAEDLTQDTLLRLWSLRAELTGVKSLEAYALTVCRNLSLDRIGQKERGNLSVETDRIDAPDPTLSPEDRAVHNDRMRRVAQIFNTLPERLRTALQLRDIEGLPYAEAAEAMGITEALFKVTLHRARRAVRTEYDKIEQYGL